jgi:hypothetical protein
MIKWGSNIPVIWLQNLQYVHDKRILFLQSTLSHLRLFNSLPPRASLSQINASWWHLSRVRPCHFNRPASLCLPLPFAHLSSSKLHPKCHLEMLIPINAIIALLISTIRALLDRSWEYVLQGDQRSVWASVYRVITYQAIVKRLCRVAFVTHPSRHVHMCSWLCGWSLLSLGNVGALGVRRLNFTGWRWSLCLRRNGGRAIGLHCEGRVWAKSRVRRVFWGT